MNARQQLEAVMLSKHADWQDWTPFVGSGRDLYRGYKTQFGAANDFLHGRWKDGLWNSAKGFGQQQLGLGGLGLDIATFGLGSIPKAFVVGGAKSALGAIGKGALKSTAANAAVGGGMMGLGKMFGSQQPPAPGPTQVAEQAPQMDLPTQRLSEMMNAQYQ